MLATDVYLDSYLAPLAEFLGRSDITDIYINRPGEVWIETLGGIIERLDVPALSDAVLRRLAHQIAASNAQGVSRGNPLLAGALPDGSRVQVVLPPATRGHPAFAIRKHVSAGMSLDDFAASGAFAKTRTVKSARQKALSECANSSDMVGQLRDAVRNRQNILISGGTSSGKTTFLNALLQEIPTEERLVLIEDTPELRLHHPNAVGLLAVRGQMGEANITAEDLLIASLRMRPDRIILGEIRGTEAMTFLRAINTGHPGSLTTVHADSPERAIDQLALLALQGGSRLGWDEVRRYIAESVPVLVQLSRDSGGRKVQSITAPTATA